jgi:carbamate kinase
VASSVEILRAGLFTIGKIRSLSEKFQGDRFASSEGAVTVAGKVAVVAVGGNALTREDQPGAAQQINENAAQMAAGICALADAGWRVVVVHGNGPQVGNLVIQQETAAGLVPPQPLSVLGAMTEGQLGSALALAIGATRGPGSAVALVSHVTVNPEDAAFQAPTKPVGPFFDAAHAEQMGRERGWITTEDSGRGYRRVVASPAPRDVLELGTVRTLLDSGVIVIAAGGGGVPVAASPGGAFAGVDAVIDKDLAAATVAAGVGAEALLLVTAVDEVYVDFGTPRARPVRVMDTTLAEQYLAQGQFPAGSMGPKISAAVSFVRDSGASAVVTSAAHMAAALAPDAPVGTRIVPATVMSRA